MPKPVRLPFGDLLSGRWVCYWAEIKGITGSVQLSLGADGGTVMVILRDFAASDHFSIGSKVVRGCAKRKAHAESTARLTGLNVLIVDDNAASRRILTEIIAEEGMVPTVAESAAAGLHFLRVAAGPDSAFNLVLIDCHMPEADGFSLVEEMRRDDAISRTAFVMLTSAGQRDDGARCRALGVAAYVTKPISSRELLEAIGLALGSKFETARTAELITRHTLPAGVAGLRVLVAEDSLINQKVTCRMLESQNCSVTVVGDGLEVLQALKLQAFDLVLMDIQMPEMDGLQATAAIRERERVSGAHIPIIALTAHAMSGDRDRFLDAGMDGYVTKPVRAPELLSELARMRVGNTERSHVDLSVAS